MILYNQIQSQKSLTVIMTNSDQETQSNQSSGQTEELIPSSMDTQNPNVRSGDLNVEVDLDQLKPIMKRYKKLKKYMRSPLYQIKKMDGTENVISKLLKD